MAFGVADKEKYRQHHLFVYFPLLLSPTMFLAASSHGRDDEAWSKPEKGLEDMLLIIGLLCSSLGLALVVNIFVKRKRRRIPQNNECVLPGPIGPPLIGQSFSLDMEKAYVDFTNLQEKYGDIYSLSLFGKNIVILGNAEYVRKAFSSKKYSPYLNDRPSSFLGHYIAQSYKDILLRRNDAKFDKVKNICMSAMHSFGDGCASSRDAIAKELHHVVSKFGRRNGTNVNPMDIINLSISNITAIMFTGKRFDDTDPVVRCIAEFDDWGAKLIQPKTHSLLKTFPFLRYMPGKYREMYDHLVSGRSDISERLITEMKKTYVPDQIQCLIHALMKAVEEERELGSHWLTDDYILGTLMDLINTGGLTSKGVLSGLILIMAHSPVIQKKIREEIIQVVGTARTPLTDDIEEMPYTHACILECLRFQSHLPLTAGHSNATCDVTFEGYFIPKDSVIYANLWSIHHDSRLWDAPWQFNPQRFLDSNGQILPITDPIRQSFLPFGVGNRVCVGKTMAINRTFLYISNILQNFEIQPPEGAVLPSMDPRHLVPGTVLQAPDFECRFTPLKTQSS
ncbi:hypothetical protein ScPMuIL_003461 [Solemya velum]